MQPKSLVQQLEAIEGEGHLLSTTNHTGTQLWFVCQNSIVQLETAGGTISLVSGDAVAVFSSDKAEHHTTVRLYNNCLPETHPDHRIGMMSRNINKTRGFFRVAPTRTEAVKTAKKKKSAK